MSRGDESKRLSPQHARLVSVLVAGGTSGVETDGIMEALWGEQLPKAGTQAVYSLVARLDGRAELLQNDGGRYRIATDVDVDAWRFDELTSRDDVDAQLEGIRLWRGRPFDGIEAGQLVADEANRLARKQIAAAEFVARHATRTQLRDAEEQILRATDDDPYNEPLVIAAASALYRLNKRRDALSILQSCRSRLRLDLGLGGSAELDAAELALLNDENPGARAQKPVPSPSAHHRPLPILLAPRAPLFVGRNDELRMLDTALATALDPGGRGGVAVVHGEAGIGKSELVSQFVHSRPDISVRVGTNSTGSSAAYAAWLRAVPEAADALAQLSAASDPGAANLVFWRDVERTLLALASGGPLVILLEDMHQADPQSMLLFSWLASGSLSSSVLLVATCRPADDGSSWAAVINDLRSRQDTRVATVIDVGPLSLASIQQMVAARFPDHSPARTFRFASQVHDLSRGNPLVSSALVKDAVEPADLVTGSPLTIEEHHAQSVRGRVGSVVSGVLTNAGLIGHEFEVEVVAALSEMSPSDALVHLETAMAEGLIVEAEQLGRFRFDHILTAEAFAQRASRLRRSQTYRSLIEFKELPAADRVRYIRGAFAESTDSGAAEAAALFWEEAQKLAASLSFSEARSACEYAVEATLAGGARPDVELLILRAEVTARAGDLNRMEEYRLEAFEAAASNGSVDDMARAALVGLPAVERHEGDPSLVALLEQIDHNQITDAAVRGMFLYQFVRSARIVDRSELAMRQAESITKADMGGDDELWAEFSNERLQIEHQSKPRASIVTELDDLATSLEPCNARTNLVFRAWLYSAVHQLDDAFTTRLDSTRAELLMVPEPRAQWIFELLESALGLAGLVETSSNAESVLATGFRLGVADAFAGFGAQSWHKLCLENRFDDALALLEGARGLIEPNVGWQCAEAFSLASVGRSDESAALAESAAVELARNPTGLWAAPAAALLTEACHWLDDPQRPARAAAEVLQPHSGAAVILGAGAAYLGPADLFIGRALRLAGDTAAKTFTDRGREQAERTGFVRWEGWT